MDNQTIFLALIAVFVAVSAAALIFQAAMLYGTYKASMELRDRIVPLTVKVDALVDTSRTTIDEARIKNGWDPLNRSVPHMTIHDATIASIAILGVLGS